MRHDDQAPDDEGRSRAEKGQIIILFAMFSTVLIGMLGLAMDLGFAFSQKRTIQNAADAGALAGAWHILHNETQVRPEVVSFVEGKLENEMPGTANEMIYCKYLFGEVKDGTDDGLGGDCHAPVVAGAKGVYVEVEEEHSTFFIKVVCGDIDDRCDSVTTRAKAAARVERLGKPPGDGRFIICGTKPWAVLAADEKTTLDANEPSILIKGADGKWILNEAADNVTYRIFDQKISTGSEGSLKVEKQAGCKTQGGDFKGAASWKVNANYSVLPAWFSHQTGVDQGKIFNDVEGVQGCKVTVVTGCVMLLPLAVDDPAQDGDHLNQIYVVTFGAFFVTMSDQGSVEFRGKFDYDYVVSGPSENTWVKGDGGIAVIRLIQ